MKTSLTASILSLASLGLAACGSQAGTGYEGDSLMSVTGKVIIQNDEAPDSLVPALAFGKPHSDSAARHLGTFEVADVTVSGEFPARFTLDVLEPPPADVFVQPFGADGGEPRFAFAYITAVTPEHPDTFELSDEIESAACDHDDAGNPVDCIQETIRCGAEQNYQLNGDPNGDCYHDVRDCNPDFTTCTPGKSYGNPEFARDIWQNFAGLSKNYLVVYLESDARAGTKTAYVWGQGKTLSAGYHLIQFVPATDAETQTTRTCVEAAQSVAFNRYNAKHGTDYHADSDIPDEDVAASKEVEALTQDVTVEKNCPFILLDQRVVPIVPSREHPVSVEIGTDVKPDTLFWIYE